MKGVYVLGTIFIILWSQLSIATAQDALTVTVSGPEGPLNAASFEDTTSFDVTITFSEAVSGFEEEDIAFSGPATLKLSGSDGDTMYTATITPEEGAEGNVTLSVPENVAKPADADADAVDSNTASELYTVHVDIIPPTVSITNEPSEDEDQNTAFDITVTFSEPVNGFQALELVDSGQYVDAAFISGGADGEYDAEYTVRITPKDDSEGDVTIQVPMDAAQDKAGNGNLTSTTNYTVHVDTIPPTVTSITEPPTGEQNTAFDITVTFSEPVNGFQAPELVDSGQYVDAAFMSGGADGEYNAEYTVRITPKDDSEGDVTIQVPMDAAQDKAGNGNLTSTTSYTVHVDTEAPTVEVTDVPVDEQNAAFDVTVTFSEAVNGFSVDDDITLTGPAAASLNTGGDGDSVYTVTITPDADSEGDVTIEVHEGAVQDEAGNDNTVSNTYTVHVDTIPPTVESIDVPSAPQNDVFDVTVTFSEAVNGFSVDDDITLTGPAAASLNTGGDGDNVYTVTITPDADSEGDVTIEVHEGAAQDEAGNDNTVSNTYTVHVDTILPTVTSITEPPSGEQNTAFDITVTFSEDVFNFRAGRVIDPGDPAIAILKDGEDGDSAYTVTIIPNPNSEGDVTIEVREGAAQDKAGNSNLTSVTRYTVHVDTIPPTVESIDVPSAPQNDVFDVTVAFSEAVNGFSVDDDITLTGPVTASLNTGEDGDSAYTVTITPDADEEDDVNFSIPWRVVVDFAGNANGASDIYIVHVDTRLPTVTIENVPTEVQLGEFSVDITFSEAVFGFNEADITFEDDPVVEIYELSGSGSRYTLTITPHEDTDGALKIVIPEGAAIDRAANPNAASDPQYVSVAPIWIPDLDLREAVREGLGLGTGEDFARDQLTDLITLDSFYREITDLTGLEYATNLISAELTGNAITDLTPLEALTTLTTLRLGDNNISSIAPLADLTGLTVLNLAKNTVGDITPLISLTNLSELDLSENLLDDLNALRDLTALTHLYLSSNGIRDVAPLLNLENLSVLHISENPLLNVNLLAGLSGIVEIEPVLPPPLIPSPTLAAAVRSTLNLDPSESITEATLQDLITLEANFSNISTIAGLALATNLTGLALNGNKITDITPLAGLSGLTTLNLDDNAISDLTPLAGLSGLTTLNLSGNEITDITPVEELTDLTSLDLSGNAITDINPIEDLVQLTTLNLSGNTITDITLLAGLLRLTTLSIGDNPINSLAPLIQLTELKVLNLDNSRINDLTPLAKLTNLTTLGLAASGIEDLSVFAGLTGLRALSLKENSINNVTALTGLTNLRVLDLNGNLISNLTPIAQLKQISILDLASNKISNVSPLARLANLTTLRLAENPVLDTTFLYPLVQRVPPVDIDIVVSQYPPWDVNEDSKVDAADAALIRAALGQTGDAIVNPRTDVNADGTVDRLDLRLVTNNFDGQDEHGGRAAPVVSTAFSPTETRLLGNYPNPFNPETWIPYQLAVGSEVQIFIYDAQGRIIRHLELGHQRAGYYMGKKHAAYWDSRNDLGERVASGIYFYQLQTSTHSFLRKMVILK